MAARSWPAGCSGEFFGVPPTGRRVSYDFVDIWRVTGGRLVWRYLLCDWKGLLDQADTDSSVSGTTRQ